MKKLPGGRLCAFASILLLVSCGGGGGGPSSASPTPVGPVANPISRSADPAVPFVQQQLSGTDPEGRTLQYQLNSPPTGTGYRDAYVEPAGGVLNLTLTATTGQVTILYSVTNGVVTSAPAAVSITVSPTATNDTGLNQADPRVYSAFEREVFDGERAGVAGGDAVLPPSIDLSSNFPSPGNQGNQNSCTAWSVAYAMKSYHEKVEEGWPLNTPGTTFSPAYIYNQINGGQDQGSFIHEALQLVIDQGVATLATTPYTDTNFLAQPTNAARTEAFNFRASRFATISSLSQIKAALVNRYPVVIAMKVFPSFYDLVGPNSLYNTYAGTNTGPHGNHAVTIVGYDDGRFGGSLKILNSWGRNWGDQGYFYLPYEGVPIVLNEAYVLQDGRNGNHAVDPYVPPPPTGLPNLEVLGWSADFDGHPGGAGFLRYEVGNTGQGVAAAGADVNLVLTNDNTLDTVVAYLVYEGIPFDLAPGGTAFRNQANQLNFTIPNVADGTYYMGLWIDDLSKVAESNEGDNFSPAGGSTQIQNTTADLQVDFWLADWNEVSGAGTLEYTVSNTGGAAVATAEWANSLWLTDSYDFTGQYYLLFSENGLALPPGQNVFRNQSNPAAFNLFQAANGAPVAAGDYLMAFVADPYNVVAEAEEFNVSFGQDVVTIAANEATLAPASKNAATAARSFNGRALPSGNIRWERVRVRQQADGSKTVERLDKQSGVLSERERARTRLQSKVHPIFPVVQRTPMPDGAGG